MLPFDLPAEFDAPLIPPPENWPVFDSVLIGSLSPSSSSSSSPSTNSDPLPSSSVLAEMPVPPSRSSPRKKNPDHIPRPRNAFMLFRSAFAAAQKISANIERDNRHITRIIAHCWNKLSDAEKQVWRDKAAAEKAQHAERYPNYRFNPIGRRSKPVKRNVHRNGIEDVKRCEKLAELVMAGKHGQELESAVKKIDEECRSAERVVGTDFDVFTSPKKETTPVEQEPAIAEPSDVPPFRSPLLPPTPQQAPNKNVTPERVSTAHYVESQIFYSPTDASISDSVLATLWDSPCYHYYQPNIRDNVSPPRSFPCLGHFQPVMDFVRHTEPEQSVPDFTLFSWNQSDSFSYYH